MELTCGGFLVEGYGSTETSAGAIANPLDLTMKTVKTGSIGLLWSDIDVKIVDSETRRISTR